MLRLPLNISYPRIILFSLLLLSCSNCIAGTQAIGISIPCSESLSAARQEYPGLPTTRYTLTTTGYQVNGELIPAPERLNAQVTAFCIPAAYGNSAVNIGLPGSSISCGKGEGLAVQIVSPRNPNYQYIATLTMSQDDTENQHIQQVTTMTEEMADLELEDTDSTQDDSMSDEEEELTPEEQERAKSDRKLFQAMNLDFPIWENVLITQETNLHVVDGDNRTLLHWAALFGNTKNIERLIIKYGLDVNARDNAGDTAAHMAAKTGKIYAIVCLINNGANIEEVNNDGLTVRELFNRYHHHRINQLNAQLQRATIVQHNTTIPNEGISLEHLTLHDSLLTNSRFHDKGNSF